jgi:hypothetical protein
VCVAVKLVKEMEKEKEKEKEKKSYCDAEPFWCVYSIFHCVIKAEANLGHGPAAAEQVPLCESKRVCTFKFSSTSSSQISFVSAPIPGPWRSSSCLMPSTRAMTWSYQLLVAPFVPRFENEVVRVITTG